MKQKTLLRQALVLILILLVLTSCGTEKLLVPTATATQTLTPTLTPDPMIKAMDDADRLWQSGDSVGAISQYELVLQQSADPSLRAAAFSALDEIGSQFNQQASKEADGYKACAIYKLAAPAYEPILKAQDRPSFEKDTFYLNAAQTERELIKCQVWYEDLRTSYTEIISSSLERLALYPDKPEIRYGIVWGIVEAFEFLVRDEYADNSQEVFAIGELIKTKIGKYELQVGDETVSDHVDALLGVEEFCSGNLSTSTIAGTSNIKRIFTCIPTFSPAMKQAGLLATDTSEIWYVLDYENVSSGSVNCTGHNNDTGKNFTYTYPGKTQVVYLLKDVHTGKVVAKKIFQTSTAPKCVFSSCTLDTQTNTATCTGGEGVFITYDTAEILQWLKGYVK